MQSFQIGNIKDANETFVEKLLTKSSKIICKQLKLISQTQTQ